MSIDADAVRIIDEHDIFVGESRRRQGWNTQHRLAARFHAQHLRETGDPLSTAKSGYLLDSVWRRIEEGFPDRYSLFDVVEAHLRAFPDEIRGKVLVDYRKPEQGSTPTIVVYVPE